MAALTKTTNTLRKEDFNTKVVIIGGTEIAVFCSTVLGVTEVQPGSFFSIDTSARSILGDLIDGKNNYKLFRKTIYSSYNCYLID